MVGSGDYRSRATGLVPARGNKCGPSGSFEPRRAVVFSMARNHPAKEVRNHGLQLVLESLVVSPPASPSDGVRALSNK